MDSKEVIVSSPGTPFDWEQPDAYQPPSQVTAEQIQCSIETSFASLGGEVPTPELIERPEATPSKVPRYLKTIAKVAFVTTLFIPGVARMVPYAVSSMQGLHCPDTPPETPTEATKSLFDVRQQVAGIEFGLEKQLYDTVKPRLDDAKNIQDVQAVLQTAMDPYNVSVELADMPQAHIGIYEMADIREHHRPELLTLDEAKASGDAFLLSLSQIPHAFLRQLDGFHLYLTHAPTVGDQDMGGVYLYGAGIKGENIVLDTSFPEYINWSFKHELSHVLHRKQCGDDVEQMLQTGKHDNAFISNNPPGFIYSTDRKLKSDAKKQNVTPSEYGATSYQEDVAETGASLMSGWYSLAHSISAPTLALKQQRFVQRLNQYEPNFEAYTAYLAYIGNRPFPKEIAKAESFTTECFETPNIDTPKSVGDKNTIQVEVVHFSSMDLPDGNYEMLRFSTTEKDKSKILYQVGWDKQIPGALDDQAVRWQLGYSLLSNLRDRKEISEQAVNFTVNDYSPKQFGQQTIICSAVELASTGA